MNSATLPLGHFSTSPLALRVQSPLFSLPIWHARDRRARRSLFARAAAFFSVCFSSITQSQITQSPDAPSDPKPNTPSPTPCAEGAVVSCADKWRDSKECLRVKAIIEQQLAALGIAAYDWYWALIGPDEWPIIRRALSKKAGREIKSDAAITDTELRRTWLSLRWFAAQGTGAKALRRIRAILAHEWGHVLCKCMDEKRAQAEAAALLLRAAEVNP